MKKHIKFKHIIVGCMMAAILAVPVMAFAAPNASDAAAADTPAVTEQAPDIADSETIPDATPADDVQAEAPTDGNVEQPTEADGNTALDPAVGGETGETGDTDTDADVQPADGETTDDAAATGSSTPVYYYIVGGCVVALGVGFYIALSLKQKRR